MNGFTLALIVAAVLFVLVAAELARRGVFGPDPDLDGPYDPREPIRWGRGR